MAKVHTEVLVVKMSKLVRDKDAGQGNLINDEMKNNLEAIIQELVGENVIIELEEGT